MKDLRITKTIRKIYDIQLAFLTDNSCKVCPDLGHHERCCDTAETTLNMLNLARIYMKPSLSWREYMSNQHSLALARNSGCD